MNVVVICCDTYRYDMLQHPVVKTPNLDRLASEGILFTNAFGEGLPTIQARRTMFTGIRSFPWRFEMDSRGLYPAIPGWHRIPDHQTTLSEFLFDNSVTTGFVADTYHMFKPTQNFTRGFCSWDFIRGQEGDPVRSGPLSKIDVSPYVPDGVTNTGNLHQYLLNMLDREKEEDYLPARVFSRACSWIDQNRENDPWFLWIDSFAPHERWDPPMEFADEYFKTGKSKNYIQPQVINTTNPSNDEIERTKALYYGYVTFVDKWIGVFLDRLKETGMHEDTAVIFTSDHGTELWDKGRFGKAPERLYRYNTGIPLIIRLPDGRQAGTQRDDFVQHQDIFPTISELMGARPGFEMPLDGRNLLDDSVPADDTIITAWSKNVSVRSREWNLLLNSDVKDSARELYNLQHDPSESENVIEDNPGIVKELTAFLESKLGELPYPIRHFGDTKRRPPLVAQ